MGRGLLRSQCNTCSVRSSPASDVCKGRRNLQPTCFPTICCGMGSWDCRHTPPVSQPDSRLVCRQPPGWHKLMFDVCTVCDWARKHYHIIFISTSVKQHYQRLDRDVILDHDFHYGAYMAFHPAKRSPHQAPCRLFSPAFVCLRKLFVGPPGSTF